MSDADRLLSLVEGAIVLHGGDLAGSTKHADGALQLFDGRVTVRAELKEFDENRQGIVHAHLHTMLHEYDDEVLDACLMGTATEHDEALSQAAAIWVTCVAGPIRAFIDNRPVCTTCRVGVAGGDPSQGFVEGDCGLGGLRAFVGPAMFRGFNGERIAEAIDDTKPWFQYAAEWARRQRSDDGRRIRPIELFDAAKSGRKKQAVVEVLVAFW